MILCSVDKDNTLERFDLSQLVKTPTRVTANSDTLIDHIYTNKPENICEIIVPYLALSDHYPVCVTRRFPKSERKRKHVEVQYVISKTSMKLNSVQTSYIQISIQ